MKELIIEALNMFISQVMYVADELQGSFYWTSNSIYVRNKI